MKKNTSRYKDSVFRMLFKKPDKLRHLYNALTGSSYGKNTPVEITTLRYVLSIGLRNDISFTIGGKTIVFIEHQSTIGPNLPVRLLFYAAAVYEKIIPYKELYGRKRKKIPSPEFYLFYNGKTPFPDSEVLKLSDSFEGKCENEKPSLDLEVKAYNINNGRNRELLEKNRDLGEYAQFVEIVREEQERAGPDPEDREEAFRLAIMRCIDNNILKAFLKEHREEVVSKHLSITMEEFIEIQKEEAREEAILETARKMKDAGLCADGPLVESLSSRVDARLSSQINEIARGLITQLQDTPEEELLKEVLEDDGNFKQI